MRNLAIALFLSTLLTANAVAQSNLNGWEVEKRDGVCMATHAYKDKEDDNAQNVISIGLIKSPDGNDVLIISLFYEKWKNDGDETADLLLGSTRLLSRAKWKMHDKNTLVGTFTGAQTIMEGLSSAKKIVLQFNADTKAVFDYPNANQAIGALQFCKGAR